MRYSPAAAQPMPCLAPWGMQRWYAPRSLPHSQTQPVSRNLCSACIRHMHACHPPTIVGKLLHRCTQPALRLQPGLQLLVLALFPQFILQPGLQNSLAIVLCELGLSKALKAEATAAIRARCGPPRTTAQRLLPHRAASSTRTMCFKAASAELRLRRKDSGLMPTPTGSFAKGPPLPSPVLPTRTCEHEIHVRAGAIAPITTTYFPANGFKSPACVVPGVAGRGVVVPGLAPSFDGRAARSNTRLPDIQHARRTSERIPARS